MIQYILKLALSLGLFVWLLWSGEVRLESFQQLAKHKSYVAGVFFAQAALLLLAALRWRILAQAFSMEVPYFRILRFFLMGEFFSLFFLGALGGDLSRMMFLGAHEPRRKPAAALTVILDKALALWVLCGIAFTALWRYEPLSGAETWVATLKVALALPLAAVPIALLLLQWLPSVVTAVVGKTGQFESLLSLQEPLSRLPAAVYLKIALLNLFAQALVIVNFMGCAFALGVFHVPFGTYFMAVPLGFIALALPFSIAGLGVGQLAFARLFELYGVTEPAFGGNLSTLHIAVWGVFALLGGLLFAVAKVGNQQSENPVKS
ncbi:MAG: flippase-like domain-containing protein [Acidobacteria bacterium]|nr:flippase-like domain-containing protein [Acidobacteriota bacterium]MCI0722640.1 flippase-like domain-containing protein [Acidobacteriota bacterium]